jgi:hypothetical protein
MPYIEYPGGLKVFFTDEQIRRIDEIKKEKYKDKKPTQRKHRRTK